MSVYARCPIKRKIEETESLQITIATDHRIEVRLRLTEIGRVAVVPQIREI